MRPGLWFVLLILGGIGLLRFGAHRAWFVGALGGGGPFHLSSYLCWAAAAIAYSVVATGAWAWGTSTSSRRRVILAFFAASVITVAWSQGSARKGASGLFLVVDGLAWDRSSQEFLIQAASLPSVARACERGDLQVLVSVKGLWVREEEAGKFETGPGPSPSIDGSPHPIGSDGPELVGLPQLRVPWDPDRSTPECVLSIWVSAVLADRTGEKLGRAARAWFPNILWPVGEDRKPDLLYHSGDSNDILLQAEDGWTTRQVVIVHGDGDEVYRRLGRPDRPAKSVEIWHFPYTRRDRPAPSPLR